MAFSVVSTLFAIITGLVLVPVYLGYVGAPAYGVWLASGNIVAWLSILDPGIGDLARQRIAALMGGGRAQDVRSTFACGLIGIGAVSACVAVAGLLYADSMVAFLRIEDPSLRIEATSAIRIATVGSALVLVGTFLGGALQGLQLSTPAGMIGVGAALAIPVMRLVLLAMGFSLSSFAWAMVGHGAILLTGCAIVLFRELRSCPAGPAFAASELRYLFSMSLFTSFTRIAGTISNNMLAALITRHLGPTATVSFEMTRQPIEIARTFLDKPASAFMPSFAHLWGTRDTRAVRLYTTRLLHYLVWTLGLAAVGFGMLNEPFVRAWVGHDLYAGPLVNGLLVAGMVAAAIGNCCRLLLYAFGRIAVSSLASLIETMAAIVVALIAIRVGGTAGVAATPVLVSLGLGIWIMPRMIVTGFLDASDRASLLRDGVLPACGAGLLTGAVLWCSGAPGFAGSGWLPLLLVVGLTTAIYAAVLFALSPRARAEADELATVARRNWKRPASP